MNTLALTELLWCVLCGVGWLRYVERSWLSWDVLRYVRHQQLDGPLHVLAEGYCRTRLVIMLVFEMWLGIGILAALAPPGPLTDERRPEAWVTLGFLFGGVVLMVAVGELWELQYRRLRARYPVPPADREPLV